MVSERGQVTIPKKLRQRLGIRPGEVLDLVEEHGRLVVVKVVASSSLAQVFGILKSDQGTDEIVVELRGPVDAVDR